MPRFAAGTTTSSSVRRTVGHGRSSMGGYAFVFGPSSTNAGRAVEVRVAGVDTLIFAGQIPTSPSAASSASRMPSSSSDSPEQDHQLESRMREIRLSGSAGGGGREASPYPNQCSACDGVRDRDCELVEIVRLYQVADVRQTQQLVQPGLIAVSRREDYRQARATGADVGEKLHPLHFRP